MKELILDPMNDASIEITELSEEMRMTPLKIYRYSAKLAEANRLAMSLERQVKEVKAEEYLRVKREEVKVTEAHTSALVDVSSKVKAAYEAYFDAQRDADTLRGMVKALEAKNDNVRSLSASARAEK